jgi:uncharacterized protein YbbK (DUF523 family)
MSEEAAAAIPVLVSACLLGRECRYDGSHNRDGALERQLRHAGLRAVPFCPEEAGKLGTARPAAWIRGGSAADVLDGDARVVTEAGADVTAAFLAGAREALSTCRSQGIERAFLKERSPSCGVARTHADGALVEGPGVTAALLTRHGVRIEGVEGRQA